jgi:2-polyprenyl-3-methyl-5-hydroxy-6-metoxy-1,4-benzoquinol methylase
MKTYFEKQYSILDQSESENGLYTLGPMASFTWNTDPKRLLFVLSRYKFAAKMLEGCDKVIEIGCGDGFASRIVRQHVNSLLLTDADPRMVEFAMRTCHKDYSIEATCHNFVSDRFDGTTRFDGAYLLDVLEHIPSRDEEAFFHNLLAILSSDARVIIGMPSIESQVYASAGSKAGHVNCKSRDQLGLDLKSFFSVVTLFSMNDEVVHTGFGPMANYIFAVCSLPKKTHR